MFSQNSFSTLDFTWTRWEVGQESQNYIMDSDYAPNLTRLIQVQSAPPKIVLKYSIIETFLAL